MINWFNKLRKNEKGFSLVEAITTVFVFSIIALVVTLIMVRAMEIKRRSFSAQVIQENALAALETMAKEIRVGVISNQNNNCSTDPSLNILVFTHPLEGVITYRLNVDGILERVVGSTVYLLSSNDVRFNSLRFCILGSIPPFDDEPVRVTILTSISNRTGREVLTLNLQTTVTSRDVLSELQSQFY